MTMSDYITFGTYEQDNDTSNGAEPIEWEVPDVKGGKALVISKYILDAKPGVVIDCRACFLVKNGKHIDRFK